MFRKLQWLILLVQSGNRTTLTLSNMDIFTALVIGLIIILITLLVTVTTYVINSGLFTPISVGAGKPPIDSICFAYKFGRGPYSEVGPAFTEATCLGPNLRCLGVYYDNPEEVPSHKLRWAVGSILSEGDEEPDPTLVEKYTKQGFKLIRFPSVTNAVVSSFPHHNMLCIFIAVYRVYPRLAEYIKEFKLCAHPFMEIYMNNTMYFMGPLSKQDEFYVEETGDDDEENTDTEEVAPFDAPPEQQILPPEKKEAKLSHTPSPGGSSEPSPAGGVEKVAVTGAIPVVNKIVLDKDDTVVLEASPGGDAQAKVEAPAANLSSQDVLKPMAVDTSNPAMAVPEDLHPSPVNLDISVASTGTESSVSSAALSESTLTTECSVMSDTSFVVSKGSPESPCSPSPPSSGLLSGFSSESGDGNDTETSSFEEMTKEELLE